MRVMVDTNVLFSALLFPSARMSAVMTCILQRHELVLSSFVVEELKAVVRRKFPARMDTVERLLTAMSFDFVYTPQQMQPDLFVLRDPNDYPVLYTAMVEDVDILVTGDKDFADVPVDRPEIMTPADFLAKYAAL